MYWCRDKSCAISAAIEVHRYGSGGGINGGACTTPHEGFVPPEDEDDAFYLGQNFITEDKDPLAIPCGLQLTDQSDIGSDGYACVQGENWADSKVNRDVNNFWNVDFETPSYQSSSCCSSVARFGFAGKHSGVSQNAGPRNIHDPFGTLHNPNKGFSISCDVNRKSNMGDVCGDGTTWDDFYGTGVCGINGLYSYDGTVDTDRMDQVKAWAAANSVTITEHPTYCADANQQKSCDTWMSSGDYNPDPNQQNYNQACDSPTFEMHQMSCPYLPPQGDDYQRYVRGPPMSMQEKGQCRTCHAVAKAFSGFPCSGVQGQFVDKDSKEFKVCKSACDVLFSSCGPPTQRGGMFVTTEFDFTEGTFKADYSDAEVSMGDNRRLSPTIVHYRRLSPTITELTNSYPSTIVAHPFAYPPQVNLQSNVGPTPRKYMGYRGFQPRRGRRQQGRTPRMRCVGEAYRGLQLRHPELHFRLPGHS